MTDTGLFHWLNALWTKEVLHGTPPIYIMHRFLVSKQSLAPACRVLQNDIRDPKMAFRTWQGLLGRGEEAPRLYYSAAKKPPQVEVLVARMCRVLHERRDVVEKMVVIVQAAGREDDLYREFGVAYNAESEA